MSRRNFNQTVYCNTATTRYWSLKLLSMYALIALKNKIYKKCIALVYTDCDLFEECQKVRIIIPNNTECWPGAISKVD